MTRSPIPLPLLAVLCPGMLGQAVLFAGGSLAWWMLPLGLVLAMLLARPRLQVATWRRPAVWCASEWAVAAIVVAGAAVIAWGSLATPERSWDGYATWSLTARHLMAGERLDSAYFADPAVYHYVRGYPLLQPTLQALVGQCVGTTGARLVFPLTWLLLLAGVAGAVRAAGPGTRVRLAVAGAALVPMFLEPGGGGAESGFADLMVAALVAYAAHGVLADGALLAAAAAALLVTTKNEGVLHTALWLGVAAMAGRHRAALGALAGGALALVFWLPVQQRLLAPGLGAPLALRTFAPLLLPLLALAAGTAIHRFGRVALLLLVLVPFCAALALPTELLRAASGATAVPTPEWSALPAAFAQVTAQMGWLRRFGATFLALPLVAWFAWCNRRNAPLAWRQGRALLAGIGAFALAVTGFLVLVPEHSRPLFLREGVGRYLAQSTGLAWIALGVLCAGDDRSLPHTRPEPWFRLFAPLGSRRDRALWIAIVTVQKLREGPGPWLRAVKKGIFQMLPTGLQRRLLRWTGKDQVFRRGEVRHAGPAAGVDRPGLVSVVLPVFNHADMLDGAIRSVLAQDHREFELIVVDDGSTDGAHAVMRRFLGDPRIRLVTQPNQGLPKALSTGFECATGEFFTWTSADNLMLPGCLARLVAFLHERPAVAMVYADYEICDEDGAPIVGGEFRFLDRTDTHNPAAVRVKRTTHDLNRYEDNFVGPCFLYRGAVGRLLGDYNPELGLEDYDYWMRVNRLFRLEHLGTDDLMYRYRVHDNTLSARAHELRIFARAKELMAYEHQRAAWGEAPLRVLADAASTPWLAPLVAGPDILTAWQPSAAAIAADKTLVVADGRTFAGAAPAQAPPQHSFAVFFADPAAAHAAHLGLRELPVAAFAADADTAARLAVHTRAVFAGVPGPDAYSLAVRHNANATFFHSTRDAERLRRVVPMPLDRGIPLRVLVQVDTLATGGLERIALTLAQGLVANGATVGVCAVDGSLTDITLPPGVAAVHLDAHDPSAYAAMLRAGGWQLVSAHVSTHGAAAAAAHGVPFVQTVQNSYVWFDEAALTDIRAADPHTAAYACVSAGALAYTDLRLQLDVQKMLVLDNGVAEPGASAPDDRATGRRALGMADDDFVFLMVASLTPAKAHRAAVTALARLRRSQPRAKLVCLGHRMHPLEAAAVDALARELGVHDAVVFAGHHPDPQPFLRLADAFLLPSYWEGCSLAVWEAIAAGLPLCLADVGAAREQLRHGHGVLIAPPFASPLDLDATTLPALLDRVDPGYADRLAAAMAEILATTAPGSRRRGTLPARGRLDTMVRRYEILFRWLLQGGTVPGVRELVARAAEAPPPAP